MKWVVWTLLLFMATALPAVEEESDSPHRMLKADGEVDTDKCGACHEEDFSLSRSREETCTLCHAVTIHGGAAEHLRASAASVSARVPAAKEGELVLPLTEEGRIYCGSCHFFHDPRVTEEQHLAVAWVPPPTGLAEAVRRSLMAVWEEMAVKHDEQGVVAKFATQSTRALRLPVADGSLCRHCHGGMLE